MLIGEIDFLVYSGGRLDGYGVGVHVTLLSNELESSDDGILMDSVGVKDLHPALVFLFFGKEEGIIGLSCFYCTTGSSFLFIGNIRGPSSSISLMSLSL